MMIPTRGGNSPNNRSSFSALPWRGLSAAGFAVVLLACHAEEAGRGPANPNASLVATPHRRASLPGASAGHQLGTSAGRQRIPVWDEITMLLASDASPAIAFGNWTAVSGDRLVVGANQADAERGAVYVFERDEGGADSWGEVHKLTASDANMGDIFGRALSIDGDVIVVSAMRDDEAATDAGAAYVFPRDQGGPDNWGQLKKVTASDAQAGDLFGESISLSGDTFVVGAYHANAVGLDSGAAYVFERDHGGPGSWGEVRKLTASDAEAEDQLGHSVGIAGDIIIVGAAGEDAGGVDAGAAYIFARDQGGPDNWGQLEKLTASDASAGDLFGVSVVVSGDVAVAGAIGVNGRGAAYLYYRDQGGPDNWGQLKKISSTDTDANDHFGISVALDGDTLIVGAHGDDEGGADAGAAYMFARDHGGADNWGQVAKLVAGNAKATDAFGWLVALSGDTACIGAPFEGTAGLLAGAAYVFALRADDGDLCASANECASQYCVDGVCCDQACGDGDPADCFACSVAMDAPADGTCSERVDGAICSDGVFCNGPEACTAGVCGDSGGDSCAVNVGDADTDCSESCDEATDTCTAIDPNGSACDSAAGICVDGTCVGLGGAPCSDDSECQDDHCVDGVCCDEPSCAPYRCGSKGVCLDSCESTASCSPGYECAADGRCVAAANAVSDDDGGCGCRMADSGDSSRWIALALVGLAFGARRKRQSRPSQR